VIACSTLKLNDGIEPVSGAFVSGEYFTALGVQPQLGRFIWQQDDRRSPPNGLVAVVSDHFWRTRMGGTRQALGQTIRLNQRMLTVIGVLPRGFRSMSRDHDSDIFVPLQLEPLIDAPFNLISAGYRAFWLFVGGALQSGVSLGQVNAFLATDSRRLLSTAPANVSLGPDGLKLVDSRVIAEPGATGLSPLRIRFRKPLAVLMGLVGMVLLVACLNLATLFAARAAARDREISTRVALVL
jgi:putative ABC transport system permease protein